MMVFWEYQWVSLCFEAIRCWNSLREGVSFQSLIISYRSPRQHNKQQRHYFTNKGLSSQSYCFSSSQVWMWELDCKESWAPKNWCFWIVVLEKTLESPCKETATSSFWRRSTLGFLWREWCWSWKSSSLATSWEELTHWKRPWCWEGLWARGEGDDRGWDGWMASRTRWTCEFEWIPGVGDGQGGLACCDSWGRKESDVTEGLNWTELNWGCCNW